MAVTLPVTEEEFTQWALCQTEQWSDHNKLISCHRKLLHWVTAIEHTSIKNHISYLCNFNYVYVCLHGTQVGYFTNPTFNFTDNATKELGTWLNAHGRKIVMYQNDLWRL